MKHFIATMIAVAAVLMLALIPATAGAEEVSALSAAQMNDDIILPFEDQQPTGMIIDETILPGSEPSGVGEVIIGSAKCVGNFFRFLGSNIIETGISLVKNDGCNYEDFPWSNSALEDLEAAKQQVCDNAEKALEEIKNLPSNTWEGIKEISGDVADGACWLWDKVTSIF